MTRSRRGWGSVRQPRPGGRWQARYLDPETHRLVPAASTFATKAEADAGLLSAFSVAGIGAVSIITGSAPARTAVCTRASGLSPSSLARSPVIISNAAEPS